MKKINQILILLLLVYSGVSNAQNQAEPRATYVRGIIVNPNNPLENETISLMLYGEHPMTSCFVSQLNYSINGNTIYLDVESSGYSFAGQAFTPFDTTFQIGGLPVGNYQIEISGTNYVSEISDSSQLYFTVGGAAGNSEMEFAENLLLYPNPCKGLLTIEGGRVLEAYRLLDRSGRYITGGKFDWSNYKNTLDFSGIKGGYYLLEVTSGGNNILSPLLLE